MSKKNLLLIHYEPNECHVSLINKKGHMCKEARQSNPSPPIPLQDHTFNPLESIYNVRAAINKVLQQSQDLQPHIEGICISSSGNGCLMWEKDTGLPLSPGYLLDNHKNDLLFQQLVHDHLSGQFKHTTGLPLSPKLPAISLKTLLNQRPEHLKALHKKNVCMGMIETWLLYNLTGRESYATDYTHAGKTGLFNINSREWDPFLLEEFSIPKKSLAKPLPPISHFGETKGFVSLPDGIPILAMCSQDTATYLGFQLNHFGECLLNCDDQGSLVINSGIQARIVEDNSSTVLLATAEDPRYGLNIPIPFPSNFMSLFFPENPEKPFIEILDGLNSYKDFPKGLYLVPDENSKKASFSLYGLTEQTKPEHLPLAYIESMGFMIKQKLDALNERIGFSPKSIKVLGKYKHYDVFLQFLADILQVPIIKLDEQANAQWGLAFLGAAGAKWTSKTSPFSKPHRIEKQFVSNLDPISSHALYVQWKSHYPH